MITFMWCLGIYVAGVVIGLLWTSRTPSNGTVAGLVGAVIAITWPISLPFLLFYELTGQL